ncbi:response regulator transcription factor [Leucobacter sp. wl10]|uniref:response regulator n=1 Tax=Leucobacter sp. wl10 TaxID=2304677 RepID=UPI000E5A74DE|nr:response regulator transcription factor [Leucobacter sp. wl10]RGE21034.1 DNA-binding response regulator [Leucobacter sp. wl10]
MTGDGAIRILLVDDHPIVRDGLRGQLEPVPDLVVVGEAASAEEALANLQRGSIDVVITDLRMPGGGGLELLRAIAAQHPAVRTLVLTTYDTDAEIAAARSADAGGYLLKDASREEIYRAVRVVAQGGRVYARPVSEQILRASAAEGPVLTAREVEVVRLVASGMTNRQIGAALYVGESTVKTHLQHIFRKLDAPDRAAAVSSAYELGLL